MKAEKKRGYSLLRGRLSTAQLILLHIYSKKNNQGTTIEELESSLNFPRSTIVDHLKMLESDGLIIREKNGRTWELFKPREDYAQEMDRSLNMLREAYVHALGHIHQRRLKEVEELEGR